MSTAMTTSSTADSTVGIFLIAIMVLIGYFAVEKFTTDLIYVTSPHDGRSYLVRNLSDKEDAATLLARLRERLVRLISKMRKHYPHDKRVSRLQSRFNIDDMSEVPADSKYTSYSVNKGEKIVYCLRSRDAKEHLVSLNTILFVALHELSHVMTISVGHTTEFWDNFRFLLANAIHWNVYTPVNFRETPQAYCGTHITDSPLDDVDMKKYVSYDDVIDERNEAEVSET